MSGVANPSVIVVPTSSAATNDTAAVSTATTAEMDPFSPNTASARSRREAAKVRFTHTDSEADDDAQENVEKGVSAHNSPHVPPSISPACEGDESELEDGLHTPPFGFLHEAELDYPSPITLSRRPTTASVTTHNASVSSPPSAFHASTAVALKESFSTSYLPPGPADLLLEGTNSAGEAYHWMPTVREDTTAFSTRRRLTRSSIGGSAITSARAPPPVSSASSSAATSPTLTFSSPSPRHSRQRQASNAMIAQADLDTVTKNAVTFKRDVLAGGAASAAFRSSSGAVLNALPIAGQLTDGRDARAAPVAPLQRSSQSPPTADVPAPPTILSLSMADLDAVRLSFFAHTKRWSRQDLADRMKRIIIQLLRDEVIAVHANAESVRRHDLLSPTATTLTSLPLTAITPCAAVSSPTSGPATDLAATPVGAHVDTRAGAVDAAKQAVEDFIANSAYLSGSEAVPVDIPTRYLQAARIMLCAEYERLVKTEMDNVQRRRLQQFEDEHERRALKARDRGHEKVTATAAATGNQDPLDAPVYPATCPVARYGLPDALRSAGSYRTRRHHAVGVGGGPLTVSSHPSTAHNTTTNPNNTDSGSHVSTSVSGARGAHFASAYRGVPTASHARASGTAAGTSPLAAPPRAYSGVPAVDGLVHLATSGQPLYSRQFAWDVDLYDEVSLTLRSLEREHFERMANKQRRATTAMVSGSGGIPSTSADVPAGAEAALTEEDAFFSKPPTFVSHTAPLSYHELDNLELPLPTFVYIVSRLLFQQSYAYTCFPAGLFTRVLVDPFFFPDEMCQCFPAHYFRFVPIQGEEVVAKRQEHLQRVNRRLDRDEEVAIVADDYLSVFDLLRPLMRRTNTHSLHADAHAPWLGLSPEEEDELLDREYTVDFPPLSALSKRHRHALRDRLHELAEAPGLLIAVEELLECCRRVAQDFFEAVDTEQRGYVRWTAFTDALIEHAEVVHQRRGALDALRVAQTSASVFDRYMVEPMPRQLVRLGYTGAAMEVKHSGSLAILQGPYDFAVCNSAALMSIRLKLMVRTATAVYDDLNTIAIEAARAERYRQAVATATAKGRSVPLPQEATCVVNGYNAALSERPWRVNKRPPAGLYIRYEDGRRLQDETAMTTLQRLRARKRAAVGHDDAAAPGGGKSSHANQYEADDDDEDSADADGERGDGPDGPASAGSSKKPLSERPELLEAVALRHVLPDVPMTLWTMHTDLMLRVYTTHHFIQAVPEAGLFRFTETVTSLDWVGGGVPPPLDVRGAVAHEEAQRKRQNAQRRQQEAAATAADVLDMNLDAPPTSPSAAVAAEGNHASPFMSALPSQVTSTSDDERQYAALRELLIVGTRTGDVLLVNAKQMLLRIPRIASESNPLAGTPTFIGNAHDASAGYADLAAQTHRDDAEAYIAAHQRLHTGIVSSISVLNSTSQPPGVLVTASMDGTVCVARVYATATPEVRRDRHGSHSSSRRRGSGETGAAPDVLPPNSAKLVALRTFRSGEAGVRQVIHAPSAQMLVMLSAANRIFLCGTTNQRIRVELYDPAAPHYAPIVGVVVVEAINQILSVDESGFVKVWSLASCLPITSFHAVELYGGSPQPGSGAANASSSTRMAGNMLRTASPGGGEDDAGSGALSSGGAGGGVRENKRALPDTLDLTLTTRKEVERAAEDNRGRFFATVHTIAYDHITNRLLATGYRNAAMGTFVSGQGDVTAHLDAVQFMTVCRRLGWLVSMSHTDARGWRLQTGSMELGIRVQNPQYTLLSEERAARGGGGTGGVLAAAGLENGGANAGDGGSNAQDKQMRTALEHILREEQQGQLDRVKRPPMTMDQVLQSVAARPTWTAGHQPTSSGGRANAPTGATTTRVTSARRAATATTVTALNVVEPHHALPNARVTCACTGVRDRFIFYGLSSGDIRMHRSDSGRLTKTFITAAPTIDDVLQATLAHRHLYLASTAKTASAGGTSKPNSNTVDGDKNENGVDGIPDLDASFLAMSRAAVHSGTSMLSRVPSGKAGGAPSSRLVSYEQMSLAQRAEIVAMLLFRLVTEDSQATSTAVSATTKGARGAAAASSGGGSGGGGEDRGASFHFSPVSVMCVEGSQELLAVYADGVLRYFPLAGTSSRALRLVIPPYLVAKAVYYLKGGPSLLAQQQHADLLGGGGANALQIKAAGPHAHVHRPAAAGGTGTTIANALLPPLAPTSSPTTTTATGTAPFSLSGTGAVEADAVSLVTLSPHLQLACVVHLNGTVTVLDVGSNGDSDGSVGGVHKSKAFKAAAGLGLGGGAGGRAAVVHSFTAPTDDEVTAACFLGAYPALVLADRRGRLHFYLVRGAALLGIWEEVMQLACVDRAVATSSSSTAASALREKTPATSSAAAMAPNRHHTTASLAAGGDDVAKSAVAAALARATSPGAALVWTLQMQRDTGAPSALSFDPLYATLYVGTKEGYLASFLVQRLILALDLRPLNVSDTEINLSVYWTALKYQQARCNEEVIRNILLVLFNITPDRICEYAARSREGRSAGSTAGSANGPAPPEADSGYVASRRSSVRSVTSNQPVSERHLSITRGAAGPSSAQLATTAGSIARGRAPSAEHAGLPFSVQPPTRDDAVSSPHASGNSAATVPRAPSASPPRRSGASIVWQNSLAWAYLSAKPLLTRPSLVTTTPQYSSAHNHTNAGPPRHPSPRDIGQDADGADGNDSVLSLHNTWCGSRPRNSQGGRPPAGRTGGCSQHGSAPTNGVRASSRPSSSASLRGSVLSDHNASTTSAGGTMSMGRTSLPLFSMAEVTLADALLASAVLNDAIHMLRLRYDMETGVRQGSPIHGRGNDADAGRMRCEDVMLSFLTNKATERAREKDGSVPQPADRTLRGGGEGGRESMAAPAPSRPRHSTTPSTGYHEEKTGAMRLLKSDIDLIRTWVMDALAEQKTTLSSRAESRTAAAHDDRKKNAVKKAVPASSEITETSFAASPSPNHRVRSTPVKPTSAMDTTSPMDDTSGGLVEKLRLEILTGRSAGATVNGGAMHLLFSSTMASPPSPLSLHLSQTRHQMHANTHSGQGDARDGVGADEYSLFNGRRQHPITTRWLEPLFTRHALFMSANSPLTFLTPAATLERARMEHRERDLLRLAAQQRRVQSQAHRHTSPSRGPPPNHPRHLVSQNNTVAVTAGGADDGHDNAKTPDDTNADLNDADLGDVEAEDSVLQQQLRQDEFVEGTIPKLVMEVFRRPGRVLKEVSRLSNADLSITSLCTRPNGLLFVGCGDGSMSLWTPYAGARIEQVCPSTSLSRSILNMAQSVKQQFRFMRAALQAQQQREVYGAESKGAGSMKARIKAMLVQHYADQKRLDDEIASGTVTNASDPTQTLAGDDKVPGGALSRGASAAAGAGTAGGARQDRLTLAVPAALRKLVDVRSTLQLTLGYLADKDVHDRHMLLEDLAFLPLRVSRVAEMEAVEEEAYDAAVDAATARLLHLVCGAESGHTAYLQYYKRAIGFVPAAVSAVSYMTRRRHPLEVLPDLYTMSEALDPETLRQLATHESPLSSAGSPAPVHARRAAAAYGAGEAASMNVRALPIAFAAHLEAADTLDVDFVNTAHELLVAGAYEAERREYVEMREVVRLLEEQEKARQRERVTAAALELSGNTKASAVEPRTSHKPRPLSSASIAVPGQTSLAMGHRSSSSSGSDSAPEATPGAAEQATLVRALSIRRRVGAAAMPSIRTEAHRSWISLEDVPNALWRRASGAAAAAASAAHDASSGCRASLSMASHLSLVSQPLGALSLTEDPFANVVPLKQPSPTSTRQASSTDTPALAADEHASSPYARGAALRRSLLSNGAVSVSGLSEHSDEATAVAATGMRTDAPSVSSLDASTDRRASTSAPMGPVERLALEAVRHRYRVQTTPLSSAGPSSPARGGATTMAASTATTPPPLRGEALTAEEAAQADATPRTLVQSASPNRDTRHLSLTTGAAITTTATTVSGATTSADADGVKALLGPRSGEGGGEDEYPELRTKEAERAEAWLYSTTYTLAQPLLMVANEAGDDIETRASSAQPLSRVSTPDEGVVQGRATSDARDDEDAFSIHRHVAQRLELEADSLLDTPANASGLTPSPAAANTAQSSSFFLTETSTTPPLLDGSRDLARVRPSSATPTTAATASKPPTPVRRVQPEADHAPPRRELPSTPLQRPPRSPSPHHGSVSTIAGADPINTTHTSTLNRAALTRTRPPQAALFPPEASLPTDGDPVGFGIDTTLSVENTRRVQRAASAASQPTTTSAMQVSHPVAGGRLGSTAAHAYVRPAGGSGGGASPRPESRGLVPRLAHTGLVPSSLRFAGTAPSARRKTAAALGERADGSRKDAPPNNVGRPSTRAAPSLSLPHRVRAMDGMLPGRPGTAAPPPHASSTHMKRKASSDATLPTLASRPADKKAP